jgi:hypothetical protein
LATAVVGVREVSEHLPHNPRRWLIVHFRCDELGWPIGQAGAGRWLRILGETSATLRESRCMKRSNRPVNADARGGAVRRKGQRACAGYWEH